MDHISKHPRYAQAVVEHNELAAALGKVQSRIAEVEAQLRVAEPYPEDDRVAAALEFAKDGKLRMPSNVTALRDQHVTLRQQAEAVQKAIAASTVNLSQLASELSAEVCRSMDAKHKEAIGERLKAAMKEVAGLFAEERKFIRSIEDAGYSAGYLRNHYGMPHIEEAITAAAR